jgi:hypothetical protein
VFLRDVFKQNGYNDWQIHRALNCHTQLDHLENKPNSIAFLPIQVNGASTAHPTEHPNKLAVAEHSINNGHGIQFHNSSVLTTKTIYIYIYIYMDHVRAAIEIELHPYNIHREGGFCLSKSWKPLINSLKTFGTQVRFVTWSLILKPALQATPPLPPKLGISLCSLAIYKPTPLPATPTPLYIHNLVFHTNVSICSMHRLLVTAPNKQTNSVALSLRANYTE